MTNEELITKMQEDGQCVICGFECQHEDCDEEWNEDLAGKGYHEPTYTCKVCGEIFNDHSSTTECYDGDGDDLCDVCGYSIPKEEDCIDNDEDGFCDDCGVEI